jgi:hypothetical protein
MTAQFANDRLILLVYAVPGHEKKKAAAALKEAYGAPLFETSEASIWSQGNATLSVVVGKADEHAAGEPLVTFTMQG